MIKIQIPAAGYRIGRIRASVGLDLFDYLFLIVNDLIVPATKVDKTSSITINDESATGGFDGIVIATASFPGNGFAFRKLITGGLRVGCLPVVFEGIPAAGGYYLLREVHTQEPTATIDLMRPVVAGLARSPMPEPMPVVMN